MWDIFYYNRKVEKELDGLPVGIRASCRRIMGLMIEYGPELGMPLTRYMEDGIWEIRAHGKEGIGRAFYMTVKNKRIIILHSFVKKTQKTPRHELEIAIRRKKEMDDE